MVSSVHCILLQGGETESGRYCDASVKIYQTLWRHITEGRKVEVPRGHVYGGVKEYLHSSSARHYVEVNRQFHAPANLTLWRESKVLNG
jgi:hypothetical protein